MKEFEQNVLFGLKIFTNYIYNNVVVYTKKFVVGGQKKSDVNVASRSSPAGEVFAWPGTRPDNFDPLVETCI